MARPNNVQVQYPWVRDRRWERKDMIWRGAWCYYTKEVDWSLSVSRQTLRCDIPTAACYIAYYPSIKTNGVDRAGRGAGGLLMHWSIIIRPEYPLLQRCITFSLTDGVCGEGRSRDANHQNRHNQIIDDVRERE